MNRKLFTKSTSLLQLQFSLIISRNLTNIFLTKTLINLMSFRVSKKGSYKMAINQLNVKGRKISCHLT